MYAQGRGREPHRFVQGPRHDDGDLEGGRGRRQGRRLRVDRQHVGVGRGVRGARRADRARSSSPTVRSRSGKLAQALIHGARVVPVRGNFDDALDIVRELGRARRGRRSSTRSTRSASRARRPRRSRSSTRSATRPTCTASRSATPGNITAYWRGYCEYARRRRRARSARACSAGRPRARRRSCAASRCCTPRRSPPRSGSATRRRGTARSRRATSRAAHIGAVTDAQILDAYRLLAVDRRRVRRAGVGGVGRRAAPGRGATDWSNADETSCAR